MIKILVPILLVLFLNNVAAEGLDTLDQDLKLLKSNLLLLSDKIALDEDDLAMLGHIDVLMLEVEGVIEGLGSKRFRYEGYFSEAEKIRVKIQWNRSDAELNKKSLSKEGISRLSRLENKAKEDLVNNKQYLYDSVACSDDYSLSEWRALSNRKFKAIRCTIERNKDQIYSLYKNYIGEHQKVSGDILIYCSIGRDGVITIKDSKSNLPSGLVSGILDEFSNIKMPILDSNDTDLEYKFTFLPE